MVLAERAVLQFFILICTINGLNSHPRRSPSLGILSELIGKDSKSPLIVVIDSANHARNLDDELNRDHPKSCDHPGHNHKSVKSLTRDAYEAVMYDILRTSQLMLENQQGQGSDRQLAEQCSDSNENSCSGQKEDECS